MILFYNWVGVGMVALGAAAGFLLDAAIGGRSGLLAAAITMASADLIYRSRLKDPQESTPFFHPKRGGNIMFLPVWVVAAIVFVIAFAN